ncbi:ABC transporter permease [Marinobacterium mangrovicola]|uniref:NitT/TauT family transport system permease protein n=1 Tax=Marinobacterium mangrovicola TaxID=1476959 RepID=A0A4R1GNY3_9GAMM|nr:ABC transporter permease [Marinobacterium mangrovicola]TCK09003.1 NitT/TauT family transport system permease protein [Marinobacterium mangrovicola]
MDSRLRDYLLVTAGLLMVWQGLAVFVADPMLPGPLAVIQAIIHEWRSGALLHHLEVTFRRVAIAFVCAMILGGLLGWFMGRSQRANRLLDPLLVLFLNLPALVVIILLYVWMGLVEAAAVLAVIVNKVPNVAATIREGARSLDPQLEEMAEAYRFTRWQRIRDLWLPQLFPYLMASMRTGLALIWKIVLVVELLGRSDGVGFQLHLAFQLFDVTTILAYSFSFIAIVQLIEWGLLQPLEKRARRWQGEVHHA